MAVRRATQRNNPTNPLVSLGPVRPNERYLSWLRDPEVTYYVDPVREQTLAQLEEYVRDREQDSFFFGIFVGNKHVGNIKAGPIDWEHHRAKVGILIGEKEYWGKGYGTEALKQLCDHAFAKGVHCLFAGIIEGNHGSLSAFLRAGFVRSGEIPGYWYFEGEWRAHWLVTRINPSEPI